MARDTTPRTHETAHGATAALPAEPPQPARLHALVISDKVVATYPLPDSGEVQIGRAAQCEILVDDPSISRAHATLSLGPPLVLRDLGSANGTKVRDRPLVPNQPVEITPGEAIQVGVATIIIQRQAAPYRPRRLWAHDYFEVRVEEECARSDRKGAPFAVLRLTCTSASSPAVFQQALGELVRLSDVVGEYGPHDYEVLLVDTSPEEVDFAVARFIRELEAQGVTVRVGAACYPRDGRNADALMSRAGALARGLHPVESGADRTPIVAERTMHDLYALAERIAGGTISVLILGETGVGKELLAERIHRRSPRSAKPYLRLNCAALSETLLESELFGHERGAFTGAVAAKQGLLETADGGTVFLDEVGEMPMSTQVKLLRVIEERLVMRVGGLKARALDVRFVAATNRDLEAEITRGTFRQDLYFRLNGATLVIPPLRERPAEIPGLVKAFLAQGTRQAGLATEPAMSADALDSLMRYSWPGNIRELRNVIERAVLLCGGGVVEPRHLPLEKMRVTFAAPIAAPVTTAAASRPARVLRRSVRLTLDEERVEIEAALAACGGNQTRAAKMLGIGRRTLVSRIKELKLARPRGS